MSSHSKPTAPGKRRRTTTSKKRQRHKSNLLEELGASESNPNNKKNAISPTKNETKAAHKSNIPQIKKSDIPKPPSVNRQISDSPKQKPKPPLIKKRSKSPTKYKKRAPPSRVQSQSKVVKPPLGNNSNIPNKPNKPPPKHADLCTANKEAPKVPKKPIRKTSLNNEKGQSEDKDKKKESIIKELINFGFTRNDILNAMKIAVDKNDINAIQEIIQQNQSKSDFVEIERSMTSNSDMSQIHIEENEHSISRNSQSSTDSVIECEAFLESEKKYVTNGLRLCYEVFLKRLMIHIECDDVILSEEDIQSVFHGFENIYNVNKKLLDDLIAIRLNKGKYGLRDNLGEIMVKFIPYFRMYSDYILKKRDAVLKLDELKKTNKKFLSFLKINGLCCLNLCIYIFACFVEFDLMTESCVKRKLKSFLEEPAIRIMQYLQLLANIYSCYKKESDRQSEKQLLLLQSIMDIKRVTEQIAVKYKDNKNRRLVAKLQISMFANKIQLIAAHRFCIFHCSMDLLLINKEKKIKTYEFILMNDILLIATPASKFKSCSLVSVHPLIGLRVSKNVRNLMSDKKLFKQIDAIKCKFVLLPANIIIVCYENKQKMDEWIKRIEDGVDEQEHSLKQCNITDLEKRLRKQKTSKEGASDTINITNPQRIKQIETWRRKKYKLGYALRNESSQNNVIKSKPIMRNARSVSINHIKTKTNEIFKKSETEIAVSSPRRKTVHSPVSSPTKLELEKEETQQHNLEDMKKRNDLFLGITGFNKDELKKSENETKKEEKEDENGDILPPSLDEDDAMPKIGTSLSASGSLSSSKSRLSFLAGITGFRATSLKKVDVEALEKEKPEIVTNLLQSTLKNYRQFVMDDDDDESESADEWSD